MVIELVLFVFQICSIVAEAGGLLTFPYPPRFTVNLNTSRRVVLLRLFNDLACSFSFSGCILIDTLYKHIGCSNMQAEK